MKTKTKQLIAFALFLGPVLLCGILYLFGSRPVVVKWEGGLHPTSAGFEVSNLGLFLVPLSLIGLLWLAWLALSSLWRKPDDDGGPV